MNRRLSLGVALFGFIGMAGLTGCDSPGLTSRKARSPNQMAGQGSQVPVGTAQTTGAGLGGAQAPGIETSSLSVSDEIARACGIPAPREGKAVSPSFEFDSSTLGQDDRDMLALVAKCLTEGALKGQSVSLVGRTDPRGEPEYNMNLGGSRSDTVRRYMQDLGVGKDKLSTTSRGELDATGKDEDGYAKDRRVDIQLVK
jgi:peptidoglycan-associated lipoprotein